MKQNMKIIFAKYFASTKIRHIHIQFSSVPQSCQLAHKVDRVVILPIRAVSVL